MDAGRPLANIAARRVGALFAATYLVVLFSAGRLLAEVDLEGAVAWGWALGALLSYSALYLLPVLVPSLGLAIAADRTGRAGLRAASIAVFCLGAGGVQVVLVADVMVFRLHGFHMNAFVWNILRTPGGVASLGGGPGTEAAAAAIIVSVLILQLALGLLVVVAASRRPALLARVTARRAAAFGAALVACGVAERLTYALSDLRDHRPVVTLAGTLPFYVPMTMRALGQRLGLTVAGAAGPRMRMSQDDGLGLRYPRAPLVVVAEPPRWNVVWLVSESLRRDMVDPEIMPRTHAFARRARWFRGHQGGGNGTRMGMFSMFYGLYGAYWFPAKAERRPPLIVDLLQQRGYRFEAHTSALFTYPEFDQTIWSSLPPERLVTIDGIDQAWERDARHVDGILRFIDQDPGTPFFTFMFFEGPHAGYSFPPETALRADYLPELNYALTDVAAEIERIRNRYINACHQLDVQVGRVLDHLAARGLLERTVVVVTGDHGEEFMEHGRWGHNSTFSREQISPPLVLWIPGVPPQEHTQLTSHLDLAPTLLRAFGVTNPAEDLSLGHDLLGPDRRRFNVVCDWYTVVWSDERDRAAFKLGEVSRAVVTHDDAPVADPGPFLAEHQADLLEVMSGLRAFTARGAR